jgi:desulfoferrodoxin (superoxide reductase-like protein)
LDHAEQPTQHCEREQNEKHIPVVESEKPYDVPPVVRPEISQESEANAAANG